MNCYTESFYDVLLLSEFLQVSKFSFNTVFFIDLAFAGANNQFGSTVLSSGIVFF